MTGLATRTILVPRSDARPPAAKAADRTGLRIAVAVTALTGLALAIRLAIFRGIWVDEAISVHQAEQPFGKMLTQLRFGDRLPPLHDAALWVTMRLFGHGEL